MMPGTELFTTRPDGTGVGFWLSRLGKVAGLTYSDTMPGGPEIMTCTLQADPTWRHDAISVSRVVTAWRGASMVWGGYLDEPEPGDDGWSISAAGSGTWGSRFRAVYGPGTTFPTWTTADVLGRALDDGLPWVIGNMSGAFLADQRDPGTLSITEFMNLIASPAGRSWRLTNKAGRWTADLVNIPSLDSQVTRLLVATGPVLRTLAGYVNEFFVRYQVTADTPKKPATYALVSTEGPGSDLHGTFEGFWDLTSAGVMSAGTATAYANAVLAKYVAASFAGPFKVHHGQYLTTGGVPVDLGCEKAGEMVRLIATNGPYGADITPAPPIIFPVGKVNYSDDDESLEVTPMQTWQGDISTVMAIVGPKTPA
jgi:hypothetical protein